MITGKLHILFNLLVSLHTTSRVSLWLLFSENGHVLLSKFRLFLSNKILLRKDRFYFFFPFFFFAVISNLLKSERRMNVAGKKPQRLNKGTKSSIAFSTSFRCEYNHLKNITEQYLPTRFMDKFSFQGCAIEISACLNLDLQYLAQLQNNLFYVVFFNHNITKHFKRWDQQVGGM